MFRENETVSLVKNQGALQELASVEVDVLEGGATPSDSAPKPQKQEGPIWIEWVPSKVSKR